MFLMGWHREGRTLRREFHAYVSCTWPLHESANGMDDAKALLAMIDGRENLPEEVKQFCNAYFPMALRARYAGQDVTGPYFINDIDEAFDRDTLEEYLDTLSDRELGQYHCSFIKVNRRRQHT